MPDAAAVVSAMVTVVCGGDSVDRPDWVPLTRGMSVEWHPKPSLLIMVFVPGESVLSGFSLMLLICLSCISYIAVWGISGRAWHGGGLSQSSASTSRVTRPGVRHWFFCRFNRAFFAHFIRFLFPPEFSFLLATNISYNFTVAADTLLTNCGCAFPLLSEPFRSRMRRSLRSLCS
jgi:hypothetical protein